MLKQAPTAEKCSESIHLPFDAINYAEAICTAAIFCPEIAENSEAMINAAARLVNQFQPTPDFYDSPDNALGLIFASALQVNAERINGKAQARVEREAAMADKFAWLFFGDYSVSRPHEGELKGSNLTDKERTALFHRYENKELSDAMNAWMQNSAELASLRAQIGLEAEPAKPFIPVVLRVGVNYHTKGIGEAPNSPDLTLQIERWKSNARQFMKDQGSASDELFPFAWVTGLDEQSFLCLPEPIAYALLRPEIVGFEDKENEILPQLIGLMKHEYVHVLTNLDLVDSTDPKKGGRLGRLMNEYAAEVLSGQFFDLAYADVYSFVGMIEHAANINVADIIKSTIKGSGKTEIYFAFINRIGLVPTAMLIGATPVHYVKYHSTLAGRQLADILTKHSVADELYIMAGLEGAMDRLRRNGIQPDAELRRYWSDLLDEYAKS